MKIICQKDLLVEAVSNVSRAVCAKSPIPALEGILLKAEEGTLELTGYDLELGIVTTIESKTEQAGELVLSARLLLDIIRRIPGETVSILSDERFLATIRGGASEFTIPGLSAEEYPELPNVQQQSDLVLKQGVLKSMIDQTLFAIATPSRSIPALCSTSKTPASPWFRWTATVWHCAASRLCPT